MRRPSTVLLVFCVVLCAIVVSCDGPGRLRSSMEWLWQANQSYGSLARALGGEGNDEFVAIVEPTTDVMPEGYLAIGYSDSWGRRYPSLWIVAVDDVGDPLCQFFWDNPTGVTIVDAGRSGIGTDGPDTLLAVGDLASPEGDLVLVRIPMETMDAYTAVAPSAAADVFVIDGTGELSAIDLLYEDEARVVIVGSADGHPMIMQIDPSAPTPVVEWQKHLPDIDGEFAAAAYGVDNSIVASGTRRYPTDSNVIVCRFAAIDGAPTWSLELGDPSVDEQGGAVFWMDPSGEDVSLVGTSSEDYPNGWVFHAVQDDGVLRSTTFVDIVVPDYDPDPPHDAVEYRPLPDDGYALFLGSEATVMNMELTTAALWAARRDPAPDTTEFTPEYLEPVTLGGSWRGLVHAGYMRSAEHLLSVNNDGMILWPIPGDGASYPANGSVPPSTVDLSPETPPATVVPLASDLDATVSPLPGWELLRDTVPNVYEY